MSIVKKLFRSQSGIEYADALDAFGKYTFQTKDFLDWTNNDLLSWITDIDSKTSSFESNEVIVMKNIIEMLKYDGNELSEKSFDEIDEEIDMLKETRMSEMILYKLWWMIEHVREKGDYSDPDWYIVFFKLVKNCENAKQQYENLKIQAKVLSNKELFHYYYFKPFVIVYESILQYEELKESGYPNEKVEKITKRVVKFVKDYKKKVGKNLLLDYKEYFKQLPTKIREVIWKEFDKGIEKKSNVNDQMTFPIYALQEQTLKIKFLITEIFEKNQSRMKSYRELFSPIISKIPALRQSWGFFHISLIVGPWYLNWNNSEIIIPKQFTSSKVFFAMDLKSVCNLNLNFRNVEMISRSLVKIIHKWNTKYKYSTIKKRRKGNCQNFIDDIFTAIDFDVKEIEKYPIFNHFCRQLRKKGKYELKFSPSKQFIDEFKLDKESYVFGSHKELDLFVNKLLEISPTLSFLYKLEWSFLKSFDRAFWLKYYKFQDNKSDEKELENFAPLMKDIKEKRLLKNQNDCLCPFRDPKRTQSFLQYNLGKYIEKNLKIHRKFHKK